MNEKLGFGTGTRKDRVQEIWPQKFKDYPNVISMCIFRFLVLRPFHKYIHLPSFVLWFSLYRRLKKRCRDT